MTALTKTPTSGQLAGASKFQQLEQTLAHAMGRFVAIFSSYVALGELPPFFVLAAVILVGAF